MTEWKIISKAVNSKRLYDEVEDFVSTSMSDIGVNWSSDAQRASYVEMLEDYFTELAEDDRIEQFDVRCDGRNNKIKDMNDGKFILDLRYRQRHCLNVTQVRYTINAKNELDFDDWDPVF